MSRNTFPRWVSRNPQLNLREVGPNLYVGAELSILQAISVPGGRFRVVFDFYGPHGSVDDQAARASASRFQCDVRTRPFFDGATFPPGLLDEVHRVSKRERLLGPVLIHCQAGLSRSVSAAYAVLRAQDGLSHEEALRRVQGHPSFPRRHTLASARAWFHAKRSQRAAAL